MKKQKKFLGSRRKTILIVTLLVMIGALGTVIYATFNPRVRNAVTAESSSIITLEPSGFVPLNLVIKKGTSVTWKNQDDTAHAIALTTPNPPEAMKGFGTQEPLANGDSYNFTFEALGTYTFDDPQAPDQFKGTIIVQ